MLIVRQRFAMENPLDILSKAAGKTYIKKIDFSKAFLQIPVDENCQEFTTFSCTFGTQSWTRACLDLKHLPRTMQRLTDSLIDDIVISSETLLFTRRKFSCQHIEE